MEKSLSELFGQNDDGLLNSCVHCGLCLNDCPTYQLTGDEANSPRGRLALWQAETEERLKQDQLTDFYTDECVGCLACETACPSKVPYGHFLEERRRKQVTEGRNNINWKIRFSGLLIKRLTLFNYLMFPVRVMRRMGTDFGLIFSGETPVFESSHAYAERLIKKYKPTGPRVALLTGCLMEGVFREINFATIRVLIKNNIHIVIPKHQGCCGAIYEHTGMEDTNKFFDRNKKVFSQYKVEKILSNSAGCGLALMKAFKGMDLQVQDVMTYLGELNLKPVAKKTGKIKLFVDLPCHLVHGQQVEGIPESVLNATGYDWELAPGAKDCCGSGGSYNIQKPENARKMIKEKSAFLNSVPDDIYPIMVTSNHVCMMQWNMAKKLVKRSFDVRHIIQLLDAQRSIGDAKV